MSSYLSQFHYQIIGADPQPRTEKSPISSYWVFLHGLMGYGHNWRKVITLLSSNQQESSDEQDSSLGKRSSERPSDQKETSNPQTTSPQTSKAQTSSALFLTYDQRGHGRSFKPSQGYGPEDYANDLFLILKELKWPKVNLVGHSMGGRNAICFASRHPEMLNKLFIEDIGPEAQPAQMNYFLRLFNAIPTPFESKLKAKTFFTEIFPKLPFGQNMGDSLGKYLYSNLEENEKGQTVWRFSKEAILESVAKGRNQDRWQEFEKISVPTLLIRGENSDELSPQIYQEMLKRNPNCKGRLISNAGHWVHHDQVKEFAKALLDF